MVSMRVRRSPCSARVEFTGHAMQTELADPWISTNCPPATGDGRRQPRAHSRLLIGGGQVSLPGTLRWRCDSGARRSTLSGGHPWQEAFL